MSEGKETISYAELVSLLRTHLRDGISGLITGISEKQHSFQIGFEKGEIVFLTYRVFKSGAALDKLLLVDSAKIVEHLGSSPPSLQADLPDSATIISRLTIGKAAAGTGKPASANINTPATPEPTNSSSSVTSEQTSTVISASQLETIKRSAVHAFGPFGAIMCDKYLTPSNLASADLRTLLLRIAQDLGANDADTKAFVGQISQ
jgi:hypothetical protein